MTIAKINDFFKQHVANSGSCLFQSNSGSTRPKCFEWVINENSLEKSICKIYPLIDDIKLGKCLVSYGVSQAIADYFEVKVPSSEFRDERFYIRLSSEDPKQKRLI